MAEFGIGPFRASIPTSGGKPTFSISPSSLLQGGALAPVNPIALDIGANISVNKTILDSFLGQSGPQTVQQNLLGRASSSQQDTYTTRSSANSFDSKLAALGVSFNPLDNPLNIYASYSYHIRFFMTTEAQAYSSTLNPNNPNTNGMAKTVIAESGVTAGFNITSLRMESATGPDRRKRNMWFGTEHRMVITEAMGLSLLDRMFNAAAEMGVSNYVRGPYFLEIWFTGYDEEGNIVSDGNWHTLYRVMILNIDVNASHVGATYTITMADDGVMGEMNQTSIPPTQLSVKATTLGQFFKGLESQWNESEKKINSDKFARTEFKIVYPPVFDTWTLKNAAVAEQNARNTAMDAVVAGPDMVIPIPRGMSIENIVNYVTYLSSEAQKWINGTGSVGPSGASLKEQGMIRYVGVYPKTEIIGWDQRFKDYVRRITYNLVPIESVRSYTDMTSVAQLSTPTVSRNKLAYMINNNRLAKRYDYIYTGKNTEVINFDVTLENYWAIAQPTWDQAGSYDQFTQGGTASQGSVGWQKILGTFVKDAITTAQQLIQPDAQAADGPAAVGTQSLVSDGGPRQQANPANAVQPLVPQSGSSTSSSRSLRNEVLFENLSPGAATVDSLLSRNLNIQSSTGQAQQTFSNRQAQRATQYLEDFSRISPLTSSSPLPVAGMFDTKPYGQNAIQSADQNKVLKFSNDPTSYGPGTGYAATILSNVFDQNFFLEIEIEIRGDPWWMPLSNLQQNSIAQAQATSNGAAVAGPTGIDGANFIGGDNAIVFELRLGVEIDEDTGLADLSQSTFYNGVYNVLDIKNDFVNGKFTQILHCAKDVLEKVGSQVQNVGTSVASGNQTVPNPTNNTGAVTPGVLNLRGR